MSLRNILVIAISAILSLACYSTASKSRYANVFAEALTVVEREALVEVPPNELFGAAMNGMVRELDPNSSFISGDQFVQFDEDLKQQFGGVGMRVQVDPSDDRLTVVNIIPDTPAQRAGMLAGDVIVEIDGTPAKGLSSEDAVKLIRGPRGTSVSLLIERDDPDELQVHDLVRAHIALPSVYGDMQTPEGQWLYWFQAEPRIGYIRLLQFGERSVEEMRQALAAIEGRVDALVFDLRYNSGGLLDAAIEISDMFLEETSLIVQTKGRNGRVVDRYFATQDTLFDSSIPLVVLVNRNSASAAEIVAAALQDHQRAVVVGEQSYGKGTVQNLIPIEHGRSVLKLTTASYWRPSGQNIDRTVVQPEIEGQWGVRPNNGFDVELTDEQNLEIARARFQRDAETQGISLPPRDENSNGPSEATGSWEEVDLPVRRAIDYLKTLVQRNVAAL